MRFIGNIEAKVDAKGRVFLPAVFRKELTGESTPTLMLRKDLFQNCLVLYPESIWNEQTDALRSRLNRWVKEEQQFFREYVSAVVRVPLDSNGRLLIPKRFLSMAGIDQSVRFIGMDDCIEIWSEENTEQPFVEPEELASQLSRLMSGNPQNPSE